MEQGTKHADSLWRHVTDGPITLDTTALTFEMEAGRTGVAGGIYDLVTVNSRGQVVGGSKQGFVTLSSNTLLGNQHRGTVLLDASAGPRIFTLPEVNPALGVVDILLRRSDSTANTLTLAATGADKIMHKTSLVPGGLSTYSLLYS
ncbi:hypothetical protein [Pseudomonas sp. 1928-m]|uniref:hypothetical protein n=1 Tax=Pseudomonas sp. 1928-m TaxID=3033804 RepID=UPI0023E0126F|nr:hypothetical protein [Pseudomonas sp. 1928-m]MDF3195692.1 hypothetical protein [Pseudomonas sp. 1928-m]